MKAFLETKKGKTNVEIKQENVQSDKNEIYPTKDNIKDFLVDVSENDIDYFPPAKLKDIIMSWACNQRLPIRDLSMSPRKDLLSRVKKIVKNYNLQQHDYDFTQIPSQTQEMLMKVFSSADDFQEFSTNEIQKYLSTMVLLGRIKTVLPKPFPTERTQVFDLLREQFTRNSKKRAQSKPPSDPNAMDTETAKDITTAEYMAENVSFHNIQMFDNYSTNEIIEYITILRKKRKIPKGFPLVAEKTRKEILDIIQKNLIETEQNESEKSQVKQSTQTSQVTPEKKSRQPFFDHSDETSTKSSSTSTEDIDMMEVGALVTLYCEYRAKEGHPQDANVIRETFSPAMLRNHIKKLRKETGLKTKRTLKKGKYSTIFKQNTQTSLMGATMNTCRYTLNFELPKEQQGMTGLKDYLEEIFSEMISNCDNIVLLPWDTDGTKDPISNAEDIPTKFAQLQKYFKGINTMNFAYIYTRIRLGFPIQADRMTFEVNMQGWMKSRSIRMYECAVQHRRVSTVCWLVYVPGTITTKKWCTAVEDLYRQSHLASKREIMVGLTWKALNGQRELNRKERTYAMHVSSPTHQVKIVKKFLRTLATKRVWPLGVRYRVADEYWNQMKESNKQKYRFFKDKQIAFMDKLGRSDCNQIVNLDKRISLPDNSYTTLRKIILSIRDNKDSQRVFATVDEKYNTDDMYVLTYRPDKATLAAGFIQSMSTYATSTYPKVSFEGSLSIESLEQAEYESYDPTTQEFHTEDDADLDAEIQADLDDASFEYLNDGNTFTDPYAIDESIKLVGNKKMWNLSGDNDTISVMTSSSVSFTNMDSCIFYDTKTNPSATMVPTTSDLTSVSHSSNPPELTDTETLSTNPDQPPTMNEESPSFPGPSESEKALLKQLEVIQAKLALTRAAIPKNSINSTIAEEGE